MLPPPGQGLPVLDPISMADSPHLRLLTSMVKAPQDQMPPAGHLPWPCHPQFLANPMKK